MIRLVHIYSIALILITCMFTADSVNAQAIYYQSTLRKNSGELMGNKTALVKFSFYSDSLLTALHWDETSTVSSNKYGHFSTRIGQGTSTGLGILASFTDLNWSTNNYWLQISVDTTVTGSSFHVMGRAKLLSVPYTLSAQKAALIDSLSLYQLLLVANTPAMVNQVFAFNGTFWQPANDKDADSVSFSTVTFQATLVDTTMLAQQLLNPPDSVLFANYNDTATYVPFANTSTNAVNAFSSDTALFALASPPVAWQLTGNANTGLVNFIGTNDFNDLSFRTNNTERLRIYGNGNFGLGAGATPISGLSIIGNEGMLFTTTFGSGAIPTTGAGTRFMFFSTKAAFRAGSVSATQWDAANIGNYSAAIGENTMASGPFAFAGGSESVASGDYAFAYGRKSQATATGVYPGGTSVALGDSCLATATRAVAIGQKSRSSVTSSVSIGSFNQATGSQSQAFGFRTTASGSSSTAIGNYASTNGRQGSFVYGDFSTTTNVVPLANNQFVTRAAGGTVFYSNTSASMGITLNAGSGSWSVVSDVGKKENFLPVAYDTMLAKITKLDLYTWNYKNQSKKVRHIGPTAQQFYSLFGYGQNALAIETVDMDGVILTGIQAIAYKLNLVDQLYYTSELNQQIDQQTKEFLDLNERLDKIESKLR